MSDELKDHDDKKAKATANIYKNLPVYFTCTNCDFQGYTIVEQRATYISYIITILLMFLLGIFFAMILMPFIILVTRNYFHKCPSCMKQVGSDNKLLSIMDLEDKVISINAGEFGMVLTRKIVLGILLTLLVIIVIFFRVDFHGHHHHLPLRPISDSWETFLNECNTDRLYREGAQRDRFCRNKYLEKTVIEWNGYVIRVEDFRNTMYSFLHHAVVILLKMDPPETEKYPDVLLAIDSEKADEFNNVLASLDRGKQVGFNATIVSIGDDLKTRHMHLEAIWAMDGFKEVPLHIHEQGRYADKPRFFKGPAAQITEEKEKDKDV